MRSSWSLLQGLDGILNFTSVRPPYSDNRQYFLQRYDETGACLETLADWRESSYGDLRLVDAAARDGKRAFLLLEYRDTGHGPVYPRSSVLVDGKVIRSLYAVIFNIGYPLVLPPTHLALARHGRIVVSAASFAEAYASAEGATAFVLAPDGSTRASALWAAEDRLAIRDIQVNANDEILVLSDVGPFERTSSRIDRYDLSFHPIDRWTSPTNVLVNAMSVNAAGHVAVVGSRGTQSFAQVFDAGWKARPEFSPVQGAARGARLLDDDQLIVLGTEDHVREWITRYRADGTPVGWVSSQIPLELRDKYPGGSLSLQSDGHVLGSAYDLFSYCE